MITLKCGEKDLKTLTIDEFEWEQTIDVVLDNIIIGCMYVYPCEPCLGLESFGIEEEYRGKGYGTDAMKTLIQVCRNLGMKYIHGDSPNARKSFYKRLGLSMNVEMNMMKLL